MITDDPKNPKLKEVDPITGLQKVYLVLSAEERAKGFTRPYRRSYVHVGLKPKYPLRELTADEANRYSGCDYVRFEEYPASMRPKMGRYWTQEELDTHSCGAVTTMGHELSETYARDPHFYGKTYCCACRQHFRVEEFIWDEDGQPVGS